MDPPCTIGDFIDILLTKTPVQRVDDHPHAVFSEQTYHISTIHPYDKPLYDIGLCGYDSVLDNLSPLTLAQPAALT